MTSLRRFRVVTLSLALGLAGACSDAQPDTAAVEGPHADLACEQCHTGPATNGFVAAVSRGACAACHTDGELATDVQVHNVMFAHLEHPGVLEGQPLDCAACHTHSTGDTDLTVATNGCFLCHADLPPAGSDADATIAAADCAGCHAQPSHTAFATSGAPIDHQAALDRGVSCLLCHYDVAAGSGASPPATCRTCHGVPGGALPLRGGEVMDAAVVHEMHLDTAIAMSCSRCHEPVEHHVIRLASALALDCASCHAPGDAALNPPVDSTVHLASQELYVGLDPHHPDIDPAVKFTARVSCTGCHTTESTALPAGSPEQLRLIREECDACHGARFGALLQPWVEGSRQNASRVGAYVRAAAADPLVRNTPEADSLARSAVSAWDQVSTGGGVHNLPAADALLREALASAAASYRLAGAAVPARPALGPDPADVACLRCHYGVQTVAGPFQGETFGHDAHVVAGALNCSRCHGSAELFQPGGATFDPAHGQTRIATSDCAMCHHVDRAGDCTTCHARSEVAALRVRADLTVHIRRGDLERDRTVDFSHDAHTTVSCVQCHNAGVTQTASACGDCHESHHDGSGAPTSCTTCHGTDIRSRHQRTDHLMCGACHATETLTLFERADRRFCLQCHTERGDHKPEDECATCHLLISPEEAMRQILQARTIPPGRE